MGAGLRLGVSVLSAVMLTAAPACAQGWWPWDADQDRPPVPRDPVYQGAPPIGQQRAQPYPDSSPYPAPQQPQNGSYGGGVAGAGAARSPICLQLEQRLVQEGQRGSESRNLVPVVENELRQLEQKNRAASEQLERGNCYEYFLFSKTLRRTRKCVDLASEVDNTKRRIQDLDTQLQQLTASSGRSYQDDIVRELARNNCGATYQQQARRRDGDGWDEGESGGSGNGVGNFGNLGYATYRTICVRLCDGYYFPVSFSTLPNHFERDAEVCQSKCAAPAELYYHQNPGAGVDQATSAMTNEPYTQLKSAFRYRKEFVAGCSCKMAEYVPDPSMPQPQQQGALPGGGGVAGEAGTAAAAASPVRSTPSVASQQPVSRPGGAALPWSQPR
jgi:hypothetical protein